MMRHSGNGSTHSERELYNKKVLARKELIMRRILRNRLAVCVLIVVVVGIGIAFAADVIVKPGKIEVDWVDTAYVQSTNVDVDNEVQAEDLTAGYDVEADYVVSYTQGIFNKLTCSTLDPPCVLYDNATREAIVDRIAKDVPADKQGGAAIFFNSQTKKLEVYVASEGRFYDLNGNVVYALAEVVTPKTDYENVYYLDPQTGQVTSWKRAICDRYALKKGYKLDSKTGQFVNTATGQVVAKEQAVEVHKADQQ
jgi:hypothetical protein